MPSFGEQLCEFQCTKEAESECSHVAASRIASPGLEFFDEPKRKRSSGSASRVARPGLEFFRSGSDVGDSNVELFHVAASWVARPGMELFHSSIGEENDLANCCLVEDDAVGMETTSSMVEGLPTYLQSEGRKDPRSNTGALDRGTKNLNIIPVILEHARQQGRKRELRIIWPGVVSAAIFFFGGIVMFMATTLTGTLPWLKYISWFLPVLGMVCLLVAIPPTRPMLCIVALTGGMCGSVLLAIYNGYLSLASAVALSNGVRDECENGFTVLPCKIVLYDAFHHAIRTLIMQYSFFKICLQRRKPPRKKLIVVWWLTGLIIGTFGVGDLALGIAYSSFLNDVLPASERPVAFLLSGIFRLSLSVLLMLPTTRVKVQAFLARQGCSFSGAAGIAALLEGEHHVHIMDKSSELFRYVTLDSITMEMMMNQEPVSAHHSISKKAALGEVDVFFSHSWHDNAEQKWTDLQQWRQKFREANGREPKLWIDKFCINQSDIRNSLRCLPVFLAGCRKLLIIAGDTYAQRLWCVTEIFVFLEMGASLDQLHLIFNGKDIQTLFNFDANLARCVVSEDEDRLKSFIEIACLGMEQFNARVRKSLVYSSDRKPSYFC